MAITVLRDIDIWIAIYCDIAIAIYAILDIAIYSIYVLYDVVLMCGVRSSVSVLVSSEPHHNKHVQSEQLEVRSYRALCEQQQ